MSIFARLRAPLRASGVFRLARQPSLCRTCTRSLNLGLNAVRRPASTAAKPALKEFTSSKMGIYKIIQ